LNVEFEFAPELLREALTARKLTVAEFARRVGVTKNTAGNWLSGRSTPGVGRYCKALRVLGLHDRDSFPLVRRTAA
jgi:transcriptional regulator with XRE-family HTH domain